MRRNGRPHPLSVALSLSVATLAGAAALALPASPARAAGGRSEVFLTYCAQCHGEDGRGQTEEGKKKGARDLTSRKWQDAATDARITSSITKGYDRMPAFGKKLSPEEIKGLVQEVRTIGGGKS